MAALHTNQVGTYSCLGVCKINLTHILMTFPTGNVHVIDGYLNTDHWFTHHRKAIAIHIHTPLCLIPSKVYSAYAS